MIDLLKPFYRLVDDVVSRMSNNKRRKLFEIIKKFVIVGSAVIKDKKTWAGDDDIDVYLYEPDHAARQRDMNFIKNNFPFDMEEALNIDILPYISTDHYANDEGVILTDYLFNEKREYYTESLGIMRVLNTYGFYITKLAALCERKEKRDYEALRAVYEDATKSDEVKDTILKFKLYEFVIQ